MEPSSMRVGIETATDFLQFERTLIRFGSMLNVSPTRRSCCRAISNGFSRRCETWVSTADTCAPYSFGDGPCGRGEYTRLLKRSDVNGIARCGPLHGRHGRPGLA